MNTFNRDNLDNIKNIFKNKTGVDLAAKKRFRRPIRTTVVFASILILCLTMTAFASNLFSSLSGDELGFSSNYEGNGIVSVIVENKSNKVLHFQPTLKLMRWSTSEEIKPINGKVIFSKTRISPHSKGTLIIDLSKAYDIDMLEKPLTDDHYYFVLTNNNFMFGQDWMCSVTFSEPIITPAEPAPEIQADDKIIAEIKEELKFYFEDITYEVDERQANNAAYVKAYTELFEKFYGNIVPSVPSLHLLVKEPENVIFNSSISEDKQSFLIGLNSAPCDEYFKLLATKNEEALVVSTNIPHKQYEDTYGNIQLFFIFRYKKSEIEKENSHVFVYGKILSFDEFEKYKIHDDEEYAYYEISDLIYSDLTEYLDKFASQNPHLKFDEQAYEQIKNVYNYYKENLGSMLYYRYGKIQ